MKIAVASGKGGTGKTTIATNLAAAIAATGKDVAYVDADVEEPNGRIFLKPAISETDDVEVMIPKIDQERCTLCGDCSAACEYNALACLRGSVELFPTLCHSCGRCIDVCPEHAISEVTRRIGCITHGSARGITLFEGRLNVGEALAPPVTRAVRKRAVNYQLTIIDAPPGTSCPVIEAIRGTDYVVLVTEPTPFGLNDLRLAVGTVREVKLPFGVVINRSDIGDDRTRQYCRSEGIDILLEIPFDRSLAAAYSRGEMMIDTSMDYRRSMTDLYAGIRRRARCD